MIDKQLRTPKEEVLKPVAFHALRAFHPTAITLAAFGVGIVAAAAAWQQFYLLALVLWLLNRALDGLDGTVARLTNTQSDLGGYLDIVLDHVIYAVLPIALAVGIDTTQGYVALGLLLGSFYVNGASWMYLAALLEKRKHGALAQSEMTTVTMPTGLVEGAETIILFSLFLLFPGAMIPLFILMAVLVVATIIQRLYWAAGNL